ncbi:MFS transporter [Paraburkholderia sediminicola]|uniref:MFS transporter n=1 Tax=Paraburkholderia sediminicola TaxID=458836 RepID=UPI0038BA099B
MHDTQLQDHQMNAVGTSDIERSTMRKIFVHIVAFVGVLYIANLLDRVNLGYAALAMNQQFGLAPSQFGLGGGIFFAGYLLAELPSNMLLLRFGARIWLARITITWGVVSALTACAYNANSFYLLRILLGIAEAGFLPGVMLYMASWVPARHRSTAVLSFFAIGQVAALCGPVISGSILSGQGMLGLKSWQTMFVLEAIPTVVLGVIALLKLPDSPDTARWLSDDERHWLKSQLAGDRRKQATHSIHRLVDGLKDRKVWALFTSKFANGLAIFTIALWFPQIVNHTTSLSISQIGWVVSAPALITIPVMWIAGNYSDRSGDRPAHTALMLFACAICSAGAAFVGNPIVSLALIGCASVCAVVATGISWAIAPSFLEGPAAAGGFAIINAGGISAGFAGGYVIGWLRELTGNFNAGFYLVAIMCVIGALSILSLRPRARTIT